MQSHLYPYLAFTNAKTAIDYYQREFGATNITRISPQPEQAQMFGIPAGADLTSMTMHAEFTVLGVQIQCADAFNGATAPNKQIMLMIDINADDPDSVSVADAFYAKLIADDAVTVNLPYADQFWGGKMGQFTDQFGVTWQINVQSWGQRG